MQSNEPVLYKKAELILFAAAGIFYLIMAIYGRGAFWEPFGKVDLTMIIITFPVTFLLNTFIFIPVFAKRKKWFSYFISVAAALLVFEIIRFILNSPVNSEIFGTQNIVLTFFIAVIVSWLYVIARDWIININELERLRSEKLGTELAFLKTQVDPHFLFNTLNSIYALSLEEDSPKTADSIIKLSSLMRYNLHDSDAGFINIDKELDYIEKYIELQKLRLDQNIKIILKINNDKENSQELKIAPLLLIPFIENVFKHGVSTANETEINISINIVSGYIEMKTENTLLQESIIPGRSGTGLTNVKKRLDLLYHDQYELDYGKKGDKYNTNLRINLKK